MNKEEIKFVVDVHENIVLKQVLDVPKLRKAANIILGRPYDTLIAPLQARQIIYSWYVRQTKDFLNELEAFFKGIDSTEDNRPPVTPTKEEQSHQEADLTPPEVDDELADLEAELEVEEDKTRRTVLKRKLTMLKNKMEE